MSSTAKNIDVIIPPKIQVKIDSGDYKINGTQVRDKKGRIVCNLTYLDSPHERYFSKEIFQLVEDSVFVASSIISNRLQDELNKVKSEITKSNNRIERLLTNHTNNLISGISRFDEHFKMLQEGSSLTTKENVFSAGADIATQLAAHLNEYLKDLKHSTKILIKEYDHTRHQDKERWTSISEHYDSNSLRPLSFHERKSPRFRSHESYFISYSLLNIVNNINILSIFYDKRPHKRYEENLSVLENDLKDLLHFFMYAISNEGDIYDICFSTRGYDKKYYNLDIKRILKYDKKNTLNQIIVREYLTDLDLELDEDRVHSIFDIIEILEEIENLKSRSNQLKELDLAELTEIDDAKRLIFKDK